MVAAVAAVAAVVVATLGDRARLDCGEGTGTIVEVQLAGTAQRSGAALAGCERADVARALAWDVPFLVTYGVGLGAAAAWFGRRGYRLRALRDRSGLVGLGAAVAAGLDALENLALWVGLTDGPDLAVADPWAGVVAVSAWGKFVLLAGVAAYLAVALAGYVVTPGWVQDRRRVPAEPVGGDDQPRWRSGLCLSGGGVRSASFGLGVLQALEATRSRLAWSRAERVTAISGGAYTAGGWMVARTPQPASGMPPASDGWERRSPEERHLRSSLGYLLAGPGGRPGGIMTLVVGLAVNVGVLGALLWLVAVPLGWLAGSCVVEPALRVPPAPVADVDPAPATHVRCEAYDEAVGERRFTLDAHQQVPVAVWLGGGAAAAVGWVLSSRFRAVPRLGAGFGWLHARLGAPTAVALAIGGVLAVVLVVVPWAMVVVPEAYRGVPGTGVAPGEVAPTGVPRVLQLLAAAGILGAVWRALQEPLRSAAPRLGGLLVLALGVLVGGQWATHAALAGPAAQAGSYAVAAAVVAGVYLVANPEWWALAPFYRGRLRSAFATRRVGDRAEAWVGETEPGLYEYDGAWRPVTVLCAALNVSDRRTRTHHGIPAHSLTFTAERVTTVVPAAADEPATGWTCHPRSLEALSHRWDSPRLTAMTAVAVSGAAVSPAMGRHNKGSTNALLALVNLRLGLWLPNPRYAGHLDPAVGARPARPRRPPGWVPYPRVRIGYLLKELFGRFDPDDLYVYVTDGGHWENTGLVELLRSGDVDEAVCVDASGVADDSLASLAEAIGLAALETDTEIRFSLDPLRVRQDGAWAGRYAERSVGVGIVLRPADHHPGRPDERVGLLWYTKPALTADARTRLLAYHERDDRFPAHPTADQLFDEEQFESYRMLGEETGRLLAHARHQLLSALARHRDHAAFAAAAGEDGAPWPVREVARLLEPAPGSGVAERRYAALRQRLGPVLAPVGLRPAQPGEAGALSALAMRSKAHWGYDDAFLEASRPELSLAPDDVGALRATVAVDLADDRPLGFYTLVGDTEDDAALGHLFVDPVAMGTGVGSALFAHAVATARSLGLTRFRVDADPDAAGFYERMGAVPDGEVPSGSIPNRTLPRFRVELG
jgi:GNAT superfamily N-acetyltransferase